MGQLQQRPVKGDSEGGVLLEARGWSLPLLDGVQRFCLWGGFPGDSVVKNTPANAGDSGDMGSIPGWGRSPGGGCGYPLQYSCLENPMERGAWWAAVHGLSLSRHECLWGNSLSLEEKPFIT